MYVQSMNCEIKQGTKAYASNRHIYISTWNSALIKQIYMDLIATVKFAVRKDTYSVTDLY